MFNVTREGKPLDPSLYEWDQEKKIFSTEESHLVVDFSPWVDDVELKAGNNCTFKAGDFCKFETGSNCKFETGSNCTFKTGSNCTFKTEFRCTFDTSHNCTFITGVYCTFNTGNNCTFDTDSNCIFNVGEKCIITAGAHCNYTKIIKVDSGEIPKNTKVYLGDFKTKGCKLYSKHLVDYLMREEDNNVK
jgi:hypothetical protein